MIIVNVFELNNQEIELVKMASDDILNTNWCQEGKVQEKGQRVEKLVYDLLSLCEGVEIIRSKRSSALDEILKVDIVAKSGNEFNDVFAFQVKCSKAGAEQHFSKYGDYIEYKEHAFRTP